MKRKLSVAFALVAFAFAAGMALIAQDETKQTDGDAFFEDRAATKNFGRPETDQRKKEFVKLATKFAAAADEDELAKWADDLHAKVEEINQRIVAAAYEKEATRIVEDAEKALQKAVSQFPKTEAAKRAQLMLKPLEKK